MAEWASVKNCMTVIKSDTAEVGKWFARKKGSLNWIHVLADVLQAKLDFILCLN